MLTYLIDKHNHYLSFFAYIFIMNNKHFKNFINQDYKSFSNALFSLNAYEFTLIATAIGFAIGPTLSTNQQNSLGNFFQLIGQILLTLNAQNVTLDTEKLDTNTNIKLKKMQQDLNKIINDFY